MIIIPPYYELERDDKKAADISSKFQVMELDSMIILKRYFSRLSRVNDNGAAYCNIILAHTASFFDIMDKVRRIFNDLKYGLYPRASDHEDSAEVEWFLYSNKFQDSERLANLLSNLVNEVVGVKWKPIRTNEPFKKDPTSTNPTEVTYVMHIEATASKASSIRNKLAKWYSTSSKLFPDGTKLRLAPPFSTITAFSHKEKYSALVARQSALNSRIGSASCYDFPANLILDRPAPGTQQTLRQYLLSIPSKNFTTTPMFHSVDRTFRSSTGITFSFHPENATHAHAIVAGLLVCMQEYANPWLVRFFGEAFKQQHATSKWNEKSFEEEAVEGAELTSMLALDSEWNLLDPDFSHLKPEKLAESTPAVASETYTSLYQDSDSVSTFKPVTPSANSVQASTTYMPKVVSDIPTPAILHSHSNTISRMSDVDSRMSSLEERFNLLHTGMKEWQHKTQEEAQDNSASLAMIIDLLRTGQGGTYLAHHLGQPSAPLNHSANHPDSMMSAGGLSGSAGPGS